MHKVFFDAVNESVPQYRGRDFWLHQAWTVCQWHIVCAV